MELSINDSIDILDENDVYCPATVIQTCPLKIRYTGWGDEWDEIVTDYTRISPAETHVIPCKCWVKYNKNLMHWPSILYIRTPLQGSEIAIPYLKEERNVFVRPIGCKSFKCIQGYASGVWVKATNVWPFNYKLARRWQERGMSHKRWAGEFKVAFDELNYSSYKAINFEFDGTYAIFPNKRKANAANNDGTKRSANEKRAKLHEFSKRALPLVAPVIESCIPTSDVSNVLNESLLSYYSKSTLERSSSPDFRITNYFDEIFGPELAAIDEWLHVDDASGIGNIRKPEETSKIEIKRR